MWPRLMVGGLGPCGTTVFLGVADHVGPPGAQPLGPQVLGRIGLFTSLAKLAGMRRLAEIMARAGDAGAGADSSSGCGYRAR